MESVNANKTENTSKWDTLQSPSAAETSEIEPSRHDAQKIGKAIVGAESMSNGTIYDMSERSYFKPEEVRDYLNDSAKNNVEFLERIGTDPAIKKTYEQIINDFPTLRNVVLGNYSQQNAYFTPASMSGGKVNERVCFNFRNPDIYLGERLNYKGDLSGFFSVLTEIALRTGAKPLDVARNRTLVSSFILAHEFGHALDFQRNFLDKEINNARKFHRSDIVAHALPEALAKDRDSRAKDMAAGLTADIEGDDDTKLFNLLNVRVRDLDIRNYKEAMIVRSKQYRTCRSESFADTFAMNFIMRHYNRFFFDPRVKGERSNGRVATNAHGETLTLDNEILPFMDFHAGKHVSIDLMDANGKRKMMSCYLENSLRTSEDLIVNLNGDATRQDSRNVKNLGKVRNVRMKQELISGKTKNTIYLMLSDGSVAEIQNSNNIEAPQINVSPSEFLMRYGIRRGSLLSLLKRDIKDNTYSEVNPGRMMCGRMALNKEGQLISVGSGIFLDKDPNRDGFDGGNTSPVRRIYRKWRRYYIDTQTSTYELLPFNDKPYVSKNPRH